MFVLTERFRAVLQVYMAAAILNVHFNIVYKYIYIYSEDKYWSFQSLVLKLYTEMTAQHCDTVCYIRLIFCSKSNVYFVF
jgi:hypothetical protein